MSSHVNILVSSRHQGYPAIGFSVSINQDNRTIWCSVWGQTQPLAEGIDSGRRHSRPHPATLNSGCEHLHSVGCGNVGQRHYDLRQLVEGLNIRKFLSLAPKLDQFDIDLYIYK